MYFGLLTHNTCGQLLYILLIFLFRLPVIVHSLHQPFWPVGQPFICSTWWVVYKDIKCDDVKYGKMRLWLLKICMEEDSPRGLSWNFITDFCCAFRGKLDSTFISVQMPPMVDKFSLKNPFWTLRYDMMWYDQNDDMIRWEGMKICGAQSPLDRFDEICGYRLLHSCSSL